MSGLGNKEIMANNIKRYMEMCGVDRNTICDKLDIKYTTFSDWVNAKTYPRIDKIEKLAEFFGVTKADLVEPPNNSAFAEKPKSKILLRAQRELPKKELELIEQMALSLLEKFDMEDK
jgi:ORF019|nr:MAG TPA: Repressor protein CI [Caudoviricetes sp.]